MADRKAGLVLAAGRGTRFQTESGPVMPKVLRPILGRPMVHYVLRTLKDAGAGATTVIVGFGADRVRDAIGSGCDYVIQPEQKGSGHAVACAKDQFSDFDGDLVVMCGDSPLFRSKTLQIMLSRHQTTGAVVTLAVAVLDNPTGYGRIVRSASRREQIKHPEPVEGCEIAGIVEEKCASEQERAIREVNGGAYVFDAQWLFDNIDKMTKNEAGEYNLTDMVRVAVEQGRTVSSIQCAGEEIAGVNTPEELQAVEKALQNRGVK